MAGERPEESMALAVGHLRAGRWTEAAELLRALCRQADATAAARHQLGLAELQLGRTEAALAQLEQAAREAADPVLLKDLGNARGDAGDHQGAIDCYRRALDLDPDFFPAHANLATELLALGDTAGALEHYRRAVDLRPDIAQLHDNLGNALRVAGDPQAAAACHRKAIELLPDLASAHSNLGAALLAAGDLEGAISALRRALELAPGLPQAQHPLALAYLRAGRPREALPLLEEIIRREPGNRFFRLQLAETLESLHELARARTLAAELLAVTPGEPAAARLQARLLRREGRIGEAIALLEGMAEPDDDEAAAARHFELGMLYDRQDDADLAFAHLSRANAIRAPYANTAEAAHYLQGIEQLSAMITPERFAGWSRPETCGPCPVFILGFPRSGTTLLDQMLDAHPQLQVMEERNVLATLVAQVGALPGGYPDALDTLDEATVNALRDEYFRLAGKQLQLAPGRILVDKNPLHIVRTNLIQRLFPEAPIILSLRHPFDACLSNFMQDFELNNAMSHFVTLEGTAALYRAVMSLWQRFRVAFPQMRVHEVRYETLVEHTEETARGVLEFLGLPWHAGVLEHASHARSRTAINTPSYLQVTEGIYTRARYRWQRYARHLGPVIEMVGPLARDFGYATELPATGDTAEHSQ